MTAKLYPVTTETETREALDAAREALKAHDTIVMPTDTVYGIAADAYHALQPLALRQPLQIRWP